MNEDLALAEQYRDHARELRGAAGEVRAVWANDALMKAADDYERFAKALEGIYSAR